MNSRMIEKDNIITGITRSGLQVQLDTKETEKIFKVKSKARVQTPLGEGCIMGVGAHPNRSKPVLFFALAKDNTNKGELRLSYWDDIIDLKSLKKENIILLNNEDKNILDTSLVEKFNLKTDLADRITLFKNLDPIFFHGSGRAKKEEFEIKKQASTYWFNLFNSNQELTEKILVNTQAFPTVEDLNEAANDIQNNESLAFASITNNML